MKTIADLRTRATEKMRKYTSGANHYSFRTYDIAPLNTGNRLRPEDILAANLLSLRLSWREVVPLFADGDGPPQRLLSALNAALTVVRDAPAFETYPDADAMQAALAPVAAANVATRDVQGWTAVTVSKVLHRHAPHVVPLVDSRVRTFYDTRPGKEALLRARIWEDVRANSDWLAPLASRYPTTDHRPLSILRTIDILIWTPLDEPTEPNPVDPAP